MIETLIGIGAVAAAFVAVLFVNLRAGCGTDCGSCERPCKLTESTLGVDDESD